MAKDKNIIEEQNLDDALVIEEFDPEQLEVEHKQAKESALKRWFLMTNAYLFITRNYFLYSFYRF